VRGKPQLGEPALTRSLEDYLRAIYVISKRKKITRVRDISKFLKVKPSSVTYSLKKLSNLGLINYEKHGYVTLTTKGVELAKKLDKRFKVLEDFLADVLGVPDKIAEIDACNLEHYLHQETMDRLREFIEFLRENSAGNKIISEFKKQYRKK